ncbi:uncharacterized protein Dana_GF27373 [Drosophila ananassae]|uniref:Uncharacterized protein n=1 Tax=Drosophila ananassae TaxID=7217 RepID=A0A0P8XUT2_DROAN|nr:uncharacterized protein Dana_GF27373 [Drosophila ananassae]
MSAVIYKKKNNPIARIVHSFFAEFSNLNHSCPYVDAVVFKMTNVVCKSYNQSWVVFELCRLKAVGRDKVVLNVIQNVLHPTNSIQVHLDVLKKANGFKPWVISTKLDACRFMRKKNNPIATMILRFLADFSNINHTCPYVVRSMCAHHKMTKWFYYNRHQFEVNVTFLYTEDLRSGAYKHNG